MRQTRSGIDCLCFSVVLNCIICGFLGCVFHIVEMEKAIGVINDTISIVILFAVLCSFLYYSKESIRVGVPLVVIFLGFLVWRSREEILTCLTITAEHLLARIDRYYGIGWNISENVKYASSRTFQNGLFILVFILIFLFSIDVAGFVYVKRIFLLSALVLVFGMCVGKMPSGFSIVLLLTGLFGLCSMASKSRDFHAKWKVHKREAVEISCRIQQEEKETLVHSGQKAAVFTIVCFVVSLLIGTVFEKKFGEELLGFHHSVQDWANQMEYRVLHYDYGQLFQGSAGFAINKKEGSQGRLGNAEIRYSGKEVLRLTVRERPRDAVYLRGFVGKDYQGNCWSPVDGQELSGAASSWQENHLEKMKQDMENLPYDLIGHGEMKFFNASQMKIDYINAPGQYAYLPYYTDYTKMQELLEIDGDGMVYLKKGEGDEQIKSLDLWGFWVHSGKYYRNLASSFVMQTNINMWNQVMEREKQYRNYVYKQYVNVPDTISKIKADCGQWTPANIKGATKLIRRYLKKHAVYSMDLKPLPQGEDFTEYFLYTQKKGYCIHFATAAVLMYRLLGIPARFVEGYVVWPEDFVYQEDGTYTASIPDSRAHAWAEVYYDNFGFIPVDMTPSNEITGGARDSGQEEASAVEEKPSTKEDEKEEDSGEEEPDTEEEETKSEEPDSSEENDSKKQNAKEQDSEENDLEETTPKKDKNSGEIKGESKDTSPADTGTEKGGKKAEKILAAVKCMLVILYPLFLVMLYLAVAMVCFMTWNLFYHRRKYQKNCKKLLLGIKDEKRGKIIKASCKFHEYIRISGMEKSWRQLYGKNISDREYEKMVGQELVFLENNRYHKFREKVQRALYCPPEMEHAVSEKDAEECIEFSELARKYLLEKLPWYRRFLIRGITK